jgi:hypothetical protein
MSDMEEDFNLDSEVDEKPMVKSYYFKSNLAPLLIKFSYLSIW